MNGRYQVGSQDEVRSEPLAPVLDAVIEVDPTGCIEFVDARAEQLLGWPSVDLVGCPIDVLVADRVTDPGPRAAGVDLLLSVRRRNAPPLPAQIRLSAVAGPDERHRVAVAIREGAPGVQLQASTAGRADDAQRPQPSSARRMDLSGIAHDLNNVISVMLIYGELIERAVQGASMDEYLREIRAAAEKGAELTGRLSVLARQSAHPPAVKPGAEPGAGAGGGGTGDGRPRLDEDLLLQAIRRYAVRESVPGAVSVVVVDDHRMFAEGLARLLGFEVDIEVVGVGATGRDAVSLVEQHRPRVLLLDFDMPEGNGVLAAAEVKARWPETMIVMITGSSDDELLPRAIDAGCSGYLTKDRSASEVVSAVRTVAAGHGLLSPGQPARLQPKLATSRRGVGSDLTLRERKVLTLLARGATNTVIATELSSSEDVARDDVEGILTKLGARSPLEAVATAIRDGVIEYNSPF